jgi:hypothetical protein
VAAGVDGDLVLNTGNTGTSTTSLTASGSAWTGGAVFTLDASTGANGGTPNASQALRGTGGQNFAGLVGSGGPNSGAGVVGFGASTLGAGVVGVASGALEPFTNPDVGVWGSAHFTAKTGVRGTSGSGIGVRGDSGGSGNQGLIGVLGTADPNSQNIATPGQAAGVYGLSNASAFGVVGQANNGVGVQGSSNGNVGVLGVSNASVGVFANSISSTALFATSGSGTGIVSSTNNGNAIQGASNGNVGVLGTSNSSIGGFFASGTATGLYATGPASGFAARFDGPVLVNGNFTAMGGSKSAAVPHPDGSYRRLYCVESPESWFEDFGRDQLVNGRARVRLDPDFDALVRGDDYDVFLTPYGDTKGLYVSNKGPHAFEVREVQNGTGGLAFGYRVVAKRKDIAGPRLEKVEVPAAPRRPAEPPAPPEPVKLPAPAIVPGAPAGAAAPDARGNRR